jgi:hypothetical protein
MILFALAVINSLVTIICRIILAHLAVMLSATVKFVKTLLIVVIVSMAILLPLATQFAQAANL